MCVNIELLSPARNLEIGIEAINCGADAVYIGAPAYGARHAAANSLEDIKRLVEYAHVFGVKVYVTLNTIIYDEELDDVRKLANDLKDIGVDALITQDLALVEMNLPIPLHASTQMDNRTAQKIQNLSKWGFEQVVLARELELDKIKEIHDLCPQIKLETFIHGALCVSYSGQCYASQHCFGRSANRGECAQFCRLAFNLEDENGHKILRDKYLLSLKDMNRSNYLEELLQAGITSFKIEGRLKDKTYVKNTTAYYRVLLDEIIARNPNRFKRSSYGKIHLNFKPEVKKSFNRGFTEYFIKGRTANVASIHTPKSLGESVGQVKEIRNNCIIVSGFSSFHNGDGICFYNDDNILEGFRVNKVENNKLYPYPFPKNIRIKQHLYRNHDEEFNSLLQKQTPRRGLPVDIKISNTETGYLLSMSDEHSHIAEFNIEIEKEYAKTPQKERVCKELKKLGDTYYEAESVFVDFNNSYFIPASLLAQWRRELATRFTNNILSDSLKKNVSKLEYINGPEQITYSANVSNKMAMGFYYHNNAKIIEPAFEIKHPESPSVIMTCRHCIRYTLGQCLKNKPGQEKNTFAKYRLPNKLKLSLPDGRKFLLCFDCSRCEMIVMSE